MFLKKTALVLLMSSLSFCVSADGVKLEDLNFVIEETEVVDYSNIEIVNLEEEVFVEEDKTVKNLRSIIKEISLTYKDAKITKLEEIDGFYEVLTEENTLYISSDGKYLVPTIAKVTGKTFEDIQKTKKEDRIAKELATLKPSNMAIYTTKEPKMKLYIFSDFTCPYCKRLHNEMLDITNMGFEVNYIPYPRNGVKDRAALSGLQKIMCSINPTLEFDQAFISPSNYIKSVNQFNSSCFNGKESLHNSLKLGDRLKVVGTPFIYTEDGVFLGGWHGVKTFKSLAEKELLKKEVKNWELK